MLSVVDPRGGLALTARKMGMTGERKFGILWTRMHSARAVGKKNHDCASFDSATVTHVGIGCELFDYMEWQKRLVRATQSVYMGGNGIVVNESGAPPRGGMKQLAEEKYEPIL